MIVLRHFRKSDIKARCILVREYRWKTNGVRNYQTHRILIARGLNMPYKFIPEL